MARHQHVADFLRGQVASQVGDLIWNPAKEPGDLAPVLVSRGTLTTVLTAAANCVAGHHPDGGPTAELLAASAELRGTGRPRRARHLK